LIVKGIKPGGVCSGLVCIYFLSTPNYLTLRQVTGFNKGFTDLHSHFEVVLQPLAITRKAIDQELVDSAIAILVEAIVAAGEIKHLYLFGSAAIGRMSDQSDIDILVVVPAANMIRPAQVKLRNIQKLTRFVVDLVWVDEQEFDRKKNMGGICYLAKTEGRCLYQKTNGDQ